MARDTAEGALESPRVAKAKDKATAEPSSTVSKEFVEQLDNRLKAAPVGEKGWKGGAAELHLVIKDLGKVADADYASARIMLGFLQFHADAATSQRTNPIAVDCANLRYYGLRRNIPQ